jgi:tetratricopeptide (TPR) repeat protein
VRSSLKSRFLVFSGVLAGAPSLLAPTLLAHEGLDSKIESVSRRIVAQPADASLWLERAEFERMQRAWRAALADLERAEQLDPAMSAVELARARLFVDADEPTRALASLDAFDRRMPDHAGALVLRARSLAKLARDEEASVAFDRAIAAAKTPDPDVYYARGEHDFARGGEWRMRAIRGLDEGIAKVGGAMQLEELALRFETEMGEWDAALARIERLGAASPRPERWRARAAELLERAGRDEAAIAATEAALASIARAPALVRAAPATKELTEELQRRRVRLSKVSGTTRNP